MKGFADRLGLTEGQGYTVSILAVVIALLLSSLTGLTGRLPDVVAAELPDAIAEPVTTLPSSGEPATPIEDLAPYEGLTPDDAAPEVPTTQAPAEPLPPADPLEPEEPVAKPPCPSKGTVDSGRAALTLVDTLLGGAVPDGTLVSTLAIVTGCSEMDPTILALAALIEVGQSMPDLGLGGVELPVLPFLQLPDAVVALAQPLRPALDPVCGTVGLVNVITSQAGPAFQAPFDALISVSLFYAFITCGQIAAG